MILNQLCGSTSLEAEKHGLGMVGVVRDRTIPLHLSAIWKEDVGKAEDHCSI